MTVNLFLKEAIKNFEKYNIEPEQLASISRFYVVTSVEDKYELNGYINFTVTSEKTEDGFTFKELLFDADGLRLVTGGCVNGEYGGDTYSSLVFPSDTEEEAWNTVNRLENFFSDFIEKMEYGEIDISDSLDEINLIK